MTTEPVQTGTKMSTIAGQSTTEGPKGKSTAEAHQGTTASEMPKAASYGGDGGGDGYENLSNRNQKK
ncbi:hypothetical protein AAVH_05665 [Aphelenchoides avenae]|nr:hypothetical protein AAVH_05665 [Aphelenchus avenae]